ncbi:FUSC family protein [Ignatzschineria larvae DSM 13226]|uniref:FUSC family protein n=1 Tax=Ignatzschineria larvae DSM 13226 TaxID=1111732 RepID=A0ABZ3C1Z0_9GAMM|nr:FUSC family protein [Ignatzschineria larvae]
MNLFHIQRGYFKDSFVFLGSMILSALIAAQFMGLRGAIVWTSFSVLCTYSLYNAKPDRSNYLYLILWMALVLGSAYVGQMLHLTWWFYLYLFILSYFYYYLFGRDPVFDRAMRFAIILSTIGTALPKITDGLPIGSAIGTISALIVCHILLRKNMDLEAFKQGVFSQDLFRLQTHLIPRALIYSLGMFLTLLIPHYLGIEKNYWATITFVMVMPPKASTVFHNSLLRFLGSIVAVLALFLLFQVPQYLPQMNETYYMIGLLFIFSFILPLSFTKGFTTVTFWVTCYSLVMVELGMYWNHPVLALLTDRIVETALGGIIAIITSWILKIMRQQD